MKKFIQLVVYGGIGGSMLFGPGFISALNMADQTAITKAKPSIYLATKAQ